MTEFIEPNLSGKMRFRCSFCLSLLETSLKYNAPLDCPNCGRNIFDSQIESILIIAVYDKNQAAIAADSLLNMLKNTEFACTVKARLGTLVNPKCA